MPDKVLFPKFVSVGGLRVLSFILAGLFIYFVPKIFPPEEYGQFALVLSIIQVSCAAILAWPNQAFLRYGRQNFVQKGELHDVVGARIVLYALSLVVLWVLAYITVPPLSLFFGIDSFYVLPLFLLGAVALSAVDLLTVCAQSCGKFSGYGRSPVVQRTMQLFALLLVWLGMPASWESLLIFSIIGYGLAAALVWADIPSRVCLPRYSKEQLIKSLRYSKAIPLATLGAFLLQWMDIWMIRIYQDETQVGIYAWSYSLTLLATSVFATGAAIVAPSLIDRHVKQDDAGTRAYVTAVNKAILVVSIIMLITMLSFSAIGAQLLPASYQAALPVLVTLLAGVVFQMGIAFIEPVAYAQESFVTRMVIIVVIMVLCRTLVNYLLIPRLGIEGAAIAMVLSYGVGMFLQWRLIGIPLWSKSSANLLSVLLLGVVLLIIALALNSGEKIVASILSGTFVIAAYFFMRSYERTGFLTKIIFLTRAMLHRWPDRK
jgi:O-antigen/teichoic acid export membrane protein